MAYFAELDSNNVVQRIVVVDDQYCTTEQDGIAWCDNFFEDGTWIQTWLDCLKRVNYAEIGSIYDQTKDAFIPRKPFPSWILDNDLKYWNAPIPCPDDGKYYNWNELTISWKAVTE